MIFLGGWIFFKLGKVFGIFLVFFCLRMVFFSLLQCLLKVVFWWTFQKEKRLRQRDLLPRNFLFFFLFVWISKVFWGFLGLALGDDGSAIFFLFTLIFFSTLLENHHLALFSLPLLNCPRLLLFPSIPRLLPPSSLLIANPLTCFKMVLYSQEKMHDMAIMEEPKMAWG